MCWFYFFSDFCLCSQIIILLFFFMCKNSKILKSFSAKLKIYEWNVEKPHACLYYQLVFAVIRESQDSAEKVMLMFKP